MNVFAEDLSFTIQKKYYKRIVELENEYDVLISFEENHGDLMCVVEIGEYSNDYEYVVFYNGGNMPKYEKQQRLRDYIDRFLENDIRNNPDVQLNQFKKRLEDNDFDVGDSFWISGIEFKVVSKQ
jgi:hypothetical protein